MTNPNYIHPFRDAIVKRFQNYRELGEKAISQLGEPDIHWRRIPQDNSICVIVNHLHGNMLSRFTDFLDSDGEKPWRQRDAEFSDPSAMDKAAMVQHWTEGWDCVMHALLGLEPEDWEKQVSIRGEQHTVADAVLRQLAHYAYHVGQIVFIAKSALGERWQTLSIPLGGSEAFNRSMQGKQP